MNNVVLMPHPIHIVNHMLVKVVGMGFILPLKAGVPLKVAGRLAHFVNTWKVLTKDSWVLQTVKGFQIPFVGQPVQERKPRVPSFPSEQSAQMLEEVSSLVEKGAVTVVDSQATVVDSQAEFYSVLFLVPKKNGQMRPVISLKPSINGHRHPISRWKA